MDCFQVLLARGPERKPGASYTNALRSVSPSLPSRFAHNFNMRPCSEVVLSAAGGDGSAAGRGADGRGDGFDFFSIGPEVLPHTPSCLFAHSAPVHIRRVLLPGLTWRPDCLLIVPHPALPPGGPARRGAGARQGGVNVTVWGCHVIHHISHPRLLNRVACCDVAYTHDTLI
jgi:hypothetical protein